VKRESGKWEERGREGMEGGRERVRNGANN